jgi:hypothetical protein
MKPEYQVCKALSTFLKMKYPKVEFHFDLDGMKLTIAQAKMNKAIQKGKSFPDLFIMEPRGAYHGLFIEIKAPDVRVFKRDGTPASPHIYEQQEFLKKMVDRGYYATFGVGIDACMKIIDDYLAMPTFTVSVTH